jgi:hypothetical protein
MKSSFLLLNLFLINIILNQSFAYELKGKKVAIGKGYAYTSVQVSESCDSAPVSFGVVLTKEALEGLPKASQTFSLKFSDLAQIEPYSEIQIHWMTMDHKSPEANDMSHFGIHFFTISKEDRESITCTGADIPYCTKLPPSDYVAPFYVPAPKGKAMMGWIWHDSRSLNHGAKSFTSTFMYGYYNAEIVLLGPMITREFLLTKGSVNQELSVPKKYAINGYYPSNYTVKYDSVQKLYRISMENLKLIDTNK